MLPKTHIRVPEHTAHEVNEEIRQRMAASLRYHAAHPERIGWRLDELDEEWDIERVLEANAASFSLLGLVLTETVDRRFALLPFAVAAFLLQHALQGWCPPLPVFRRMGYRTAAEIDSERYALKAIRGDFDAVPGAEDRVPAAQGAVAA